MSPAQLRTLALALALALAAAAATPAPAAPKRLRRQLADDDSLQPLDSGTTSSRPPRPPARSSPPRPRRPPPPPPPRGVRQAAGGSSSGADDIPVFDRNKVSLDFPGSLFGPSVSLLIKTTKIVGDVIQNSAVRYQTFLRLFRPLFRGQFEIKGLDPAPPTTTTTAPPPPPPADNEVRRRRRISALH